MKTIEASIRANEIRFKMVKSMGEVIFMHLYTEYSKSKNRDKAIEYALQKSGLRDNFIKKYISNLFDEYIW